MPNWKKLITSGSSAELSGLKLTGLPAQETENTTLVINSSGIIGTREATSGSGTPLSLSIIGSNPNVNSATLTDNTLNLQPASINFGGVVTTGSQCFAGEKTFTNDLVINGINVGKGPAGNISNTNTIFGAGAGQAASASTAADNVAIGCEAMCNNLSGFRNTTVGNQALFTSTDGCCLTAVGFTALYSNTTGCFNTALGYQSMYSNTTGNESTAVGANAILSNTTGKFNTAVGSATLLLNAAGSFNTAIGTRTLRNSVGNGNTAVGSCALGGQTGGSNSTSIGKLAGTFIADGTTSNLNFNNSVYIGSESKPLANNQNNQIVIGYQAIGQGSNTVTIGNSSITKTQLRGTVKGGSFKKDGGLATQYLMADGSVTNTLIGTNTDLNTLTGATVVNFLALSDGVITSHGTRTLTLEDLGYTGASNANYITNNNQLTNGEGYITSYTDTNTQRTDAEIDARIALNPEGFIDSYTDTNTQLSDAQVRAKFSAGANVAISNTGVISSTDTNTDTNTTYTAGTGLTLTGTVFSNDITNNNQLTNGSGYQTSTQVNNAIQGVVGAAPAALDTLNELAASLNDDSDFAGTMTTALAGKQATLTAGSNITITGGTISSTDTNTDTNTQRTDAEIDARIALNPEGFIDSYTDTNTQLSDAQVRSKFSAGTNVAISNAGVISSTDTNTDTNTQLSDAQVRSKFSAGTNVAISSGGVISSTDTNTNTQLSTAQVRAKFSAGTNVAISNTGVISSTDTNTDTNTQRTDAEIDARIALNPEGFIDSYTDTNTQLSTAQVRAKFSAGTNVAITAEGVISSTDTNTDTNTQLSDAQVRAKFSAGANVAISNTGVISSTDTNTDTNTTYSAGNGLSLSGTQFRMAGGNIGGGVNLNTYTNSGYYVQGSNAQATSGTNWPTNSAGILTVVRAEGNTTHMTQTYDQYNSNAFYNRSYYNGTWSTWRNLAQDNDTQRAISSSPTNGHTGVAISSDWAFDNVKTAVPSNALFTDTNTWRVNAVDSDGYVSQGSGMVNKVWKTDATGNPAWRADANTNTTYSAGTGLTQTGTVFSNDITNNNQLSNGAGYLVSSNDRNYITDSRGGQRAPSYYNDRYAQWDFQSSADTTAGGDGWHALLTVSKWSSWNASHRQEQLLFTGNDLKRRTSTSDTTWGTVKTIYDSSNLSLSTLGYIGADNANYITNNNQLSNGAGYVIGSKSSAQSNSTIVERTSNGYIHASYYNGTGTFSTSGGSSGMGLFTGTNGSDTYGRSYTAAAARALLNVANGATNVTNNNQLTNGASYLTTSGKAADSEKVDGINGASLLRSDADDSFSGGLVSTARNKGIFGTYDSTKTDHIWSMGSAYKNHSSGTNFGNIYGLAYKHTNNTTGGTMGGGHQMVWATNGNPKGAIGETGIWSSTRLTVGSTTTNTGCYSSILGGSYNTISKGCSTIVGGKYNSTYSCYSVVGGGCANNINHGKFNTVAGGYNNGITPTSTTEGETISGGVSNRIVYSSNSCYNTISGGCDNQICSAYHGNNFIGGGKSNCIQSSMGSSNSILGGYSNRIYASSRTAIVGGSSITAYSSNYTYVPNLCNVGGGTSDCRLKESICNIPYGLSHVSQLEPVSYKFKSDESKATKYGFLAQCVQEIMPDLITNHPTDLVDGTPILQFDKDAIWSSMVNAIKDLKNEVDVLKARIDILEA